MTENKRYRKLRGLIENTDGETFDLTEIENLLNEQHETIQFKEKHIFCLQSVIQTIDVELQEKGMTKERFEEIKDYWYQKVMWND